MLCFRFSEPRLHTLTARLPSRRFLLFCTSRHHVVRQLSSHTAQSPLHNLREHSQTQPTLVFRSTSDDPYHNLAIEHYILTNSNPDSRILLFYTNRPCVVIGRNQNAWVECNLKLLQEGLNGRSIDLVRRRSGGGTVFHDEGNLNFSVIVPNDNNFTRKKHSEMVVRALNNMQKHKTEFEGPEHIWVNSRHDITMSAVRDHIRKEFKVSGSAYKLTRGRALHHGTLLHSSPNLNNISRFLRSPGKPFIEAKGVESVRSPVANIFKVDGSSERDQIRTELTDTITTEFLKLYDTNVTTEIVGSSDCHESINADIAKGIAELKTDVWKFEQTPRFDYKSEVLRDAQLTFTVKNALLEDVRLGYKDMALQDRSVIQAGQQKIHYIRHWAEVFERDTVSDEHVKAIENVFPDLRYFLQQRDIQGSRSGQDIRQDQGKIRRELQNNVTEEEHPGSNTVKEIRRK